MIPIILCGGVGQRPWPVSRAATPKPFMRMVGKSLFQRVVARALAIPGVFPCAVVTNVGYVRRLKEELATSGAASVSLLLEHRPRHIASAIAVAALWVAANFGNGEVPRTARQLVMSWPS